MPARPARAELSQATVENYTDAEAVSTYEPCEAVLIIEQERIKVRVDLKTADGWRSETLVDPGAGLELPSFGLRCAVGELYKGASAAQACAGPQVLSGARSSARGIHIDESSGVPSILGPSNAIVA